MKISTIAAANNLKSWDADIKELKASAKAIDSQIVAFYAKNNDLKTALSQTSEERQSPKLR